MHLGWLEIQGGWVLLAFMAYMAQERGCKRLIFVRAFSDV